MIKYIKISWMLINVSIITLSYSILQCSEQEATAPVSYPNNSFSNSKANFITEVLENTASETITNNIYQALAILDGESLEFINAQNKNGHSLLHLAAHFGHYSVIKKLYDLKANLNIKDNYDNTALHLAVSKNNIMIAMNLISGGADYLSRNKQEQTAIDIAITNENPSAAIIALTPIYGINFPIQNYETLLHFATIENQIPLIKFLLTNNADIDLKNTNGLSATDLAKRHDKINALNLFNEHYYKKLRSKNYLLLNDKIIQEIQTLNPNVQRIKDLLQFATPELIHARNELDQTPLHFAAYYNFPEIIQLLHIHHYNLNAQSVNYDTPLHMAAKNNSIESINALLINDAEAKYLNTQNVTPLSLALTNNNLQAIRALLSKHNPNNEISIIDPINNTTLYQNLWMYALTHNNIELFKILIETSNNLAQILTGINVEIFPQLMKHIAIIEKIKENDLEFQKSIEILKENFNSLDNIINSIGVIIEQKSYDLLKDLLLIDNKLKSESQNKKDHVLRIALKQGYFELAHILLRYGANSANIKFTLSNPNEVSKEEQKIYDLLTFYQKFNQSERAQEYRQIKNVQKIISLYEQYIQDHNPEKLYQTLISNNKEDSTITIEEKSKALFSLHPSNEIIEHIQQLANEYIKWQQHQKLNAKIIEELKKEKPEIENIEKLLINNNDRSLLNAPDYYGEVPLHVAAKLNFDKAIILLRKHGANPNIKDIKGNTPLHKAAQYNNKNAIAAFNTPIDKPKSMILSLLYENNAHLEFQKITPYTSFNSDLQYKTNKEIIQKCNDQMDAQRAILNIKNNESLTPMDIAIKYKKFEALEALIDHLNLKKIESSDPLDNGQKYSADQELLNKMLLRAVDNDKDEFNDQKKLNDQIKLIKIFLEKGADRYYVDTTFQSKTIIMPDANPFPASAIPLPTPAIPSPGPGKIFITMPKKMHALTVAALGFNDKITETVLNFYPLSITDETEFDKKHLAESEALGTAVNNQKQEMPKLFLRSGANPNNQTVIDMLNTTYCETFKANIKIRLDSYKNLNFTNQAIQDRKTFFGMMVMHTYEIYLNNKNPKPLLDILAPDPLLNISPLITQRAENLFTNPEELKLKLILDYQKLIQQSNASRALATPDQQK